MSRYDYDLITIGAGSGGLSVAAAAAAFGQKVVLVEKHKMGGDCLNYGCVPSKALIAASKRAHAMRTAGYFGIHPVEPMIDYRAVNQHVKGVIAAIAPNQRKRWGVLRSSAVSGFISTSRKKYQPPNRRESASRLPAKNNNWPVRANASPSIPQSADRPTARNIARLRPPTRQPEAR